VVDNPQLYGGPNYRGAIIDWIAGPDADYFLTAFSDSEFTCPDAAGAAGDAARRRHRASAVSRHILVLSSRAIDQPAQPL
jgi:hypothetical protein